MPSITANTVVIRKALNGPRAVYSVAKHPKLFLSADGKGGGSWRIRYRLYAGAQQTWFTITNDARNSDFVQVARRAAELLSGLLVNGIDPRTSRKVECESFDATFRLWVERHGKIYKRSWEADELLYGRHIQARLGKTPVEDIDRQKVIATLDEIARAATPIQANRCQALISAVFSWALDEGRVSNHPALRIRRRGEERVRELVMSADRLRDFWRATDALGDNTAIMLRLLVLLGCRLAEVCGARVDELAIAGDNPTWTIPGSRTKNGLSVVVPLPMTAVDLLERACAADLGGSFVFPARRVDEAAFDKKYVSRQCKKIFRTIGVPDMRLHDLRHQAATGMAQCGVPLEIRQLVQNQITGRRQSIGARYDQHDYAAEKRRALELWERRLLAVVNGEPVPSERY